MEWKYVKWLIPWPHRNPDGYHCSLLGGLYSLYSVNLQTEDRQGGWLELLHVRVYLNENAFLRGVEIYEAFWRHWRMWREGDTRSRKSVQGHTAQSWTGMTSLDYRNEARLG